MASFSVVNNIASLNAQANLEKTTLGLQKALNRLSSGFRIDAGLDVLPGERLGWTTRRQGRSPEGYSGWRPSWTVTVAAGREIAHVQTPITRAGPGTA